MTDAAYIRRSAVLEILSRERSLHRRPSARKTTRFLCPARSRRYPARPSNGRSRPAAAIRRRRQSSSASAGRPSGAICRRTANGNKPGKIKNAHRQDLSSITGARFLFDSSYELRRACSPYLVPFPGCAATLCSLRNRTNSFAGSGLE